MKKDNYLLPTDRNLPRGKYVPESPKPLDAPWSWNRVQVTQEILDDELKLEDNKGCSGAAAAMLVFLFVFLLNSPLVCSLL